MRFRLYREHGALNSVPVFDAFEQGIRSLGHESVTEHEDVAVIWSVLWSGRMKANREIYYNCKNLNRPVIIIEVGNLKRGSTWRISLDHINNQGIFGNDQNLDPNRPKNLGINLQPIQTKRRGEILIACQHQDSLQWEGQPPLKTWCEEIIAKIKQYTHRRIIVRPHPRSSFPFKMSGILFERPQRVPNTYDDFDIFYNYHCVINHNSGPAIQAAIQGVPVLCDSSSLAASISTTWENLDNPQLLDRSEWLLKLCHTEWAVKEISQGIPLQRLLPEITKKIS
jgi:hypothetical protein